MPRNVRMFNVSDVDLNVRISSMPGKDPSVTSIKPGEHADFPEGYCRKVVGAGRELLPGILTRSNKHLGVCVLVPESDKASARKRYERVRDSRSGLSLQEENASLKAKLAAMEQVSKTAVFHKKNGK